MLKGGLFLKCSWKHMNNVTSNVSKSSGSYDYITHFWKIVINYKYNIFVTFVTTALPLYENRKIHYSSYGLQLQKG